MSSRFRASPSSLHQELASASRWAIGITISLLASIPAAAAGPPFPPAQGHDVNVAWGGEMRQVFSRDVMNGPQLEHHAWAVGDGCVIKHRVTVDGQSDGPWTLQDIPDEACQSLLDVYFLADGLTGWACGTAGLLLHTTDGGTTWQMLERVCSPTECLPAGDEYATLWRVRFVSATEGYVCGLWTFLRTTDGGSSWASVILEKDSVVQRNDRFEFYALELVESGGEWIGVCAGQDWSGHCPAKISESPAELGGVVYRTNSMDPGGGEIWDEVFSEEEYNLGSPPVVLDLNDPWDIAFEPNPRSLTEAVGYLAGGTGTTCGTILRTVDSGQVWTYEWGGGGCPGAPTGPYTFYGVAALSGGRAVACGYGGQIWYRRNDPTPSVPGEIEIQWKKVLVSPAGSATAEFSGPLGGAALAISNQDGNDSDCTVVGSWGMIANAEVPALDAPSTPLPEWLPQNPNGSQGKEETWRHNDIYFRDDFVGLAVGQLRAIAQTFDGGATWTRLIGGPGPGGLPGTPNLEGIAFKPDGIKGVAVGGSNSANGDDAYTLNFNGTGWDSPTPVSLPDAWNLDGVDHAALKFFWASGWEFSGSAVRPLLVRSDDNGITGSWAAIDLSALPDGLRLKDVAFLNRGNGFAVGTIEGATGTQDPDEARVYKIVYDAILDTATVTDVTPPDLLLLDSRLHAVETRGTSLAGAEVYIAGGPNVLRVWNDSQGAFVPVSGIPLCPETCISMSNPTTCSIDFRSIALAPEGGAILVGLEGVPHEHVSHELGRMLRKLGPSSPWEWIPGRSIKDCLATCLVSDTRGWVLVGGDNRGSIISQSEPGYWARLDHDNEWGQVADSGILIYDAQ